MRKVPLGDDVRPGVIARGTPGFSGADLANLVNEAALFAARANKRTVRDGRVRASAKDKIMMGTERRSMVMSDDEKKLTAYHEVRSCDRGSAACPDHDPVYKVSRSSRAVVRSASRCSCRKKTATATANAVC